MKRSKLPLYTFLSVFFSILLVGVFALPYGINVLKRSYYKLQTDVNYRQARSMSQFIREEYNNGKNSEQIRSDFQAAIRGTEFNKGYVCIVSQDSLKYIAHPMKQALGSSVKNKKALYDATYSGDHYTPWENVIEQGKSGGGLLYYQSDTPNEVVYFQSIPELGWTVSSHENRERMEAEFSRMQNIIIVVAILFSFFIALPISFSVRTVNKKYENVIISEQEKSEHLLLNILPASIADRMKNNERSIVDYHTDVTILFCDIVGFTQLSARISSEELVKTLNKVFTVFDKICERYNVEKIKTIGDAYMAVCGLPEPRSDTVSPILNTALDMLSAIGEESSLLQIRVGVHKGKVVAGVIGEKKFSYDLWGDAVNTASRLESHGIAGKIQCSEAVVEKADPVFVFEQRGFVELKGKGKTKTFFLVKRNTL